MSDTKLWWSGKEYDLSKGKNILELQYELIAAQKRGAINDACAIGHTLAAACAMLSDAIAEQEKISVATPGETVLRGATHPGTKLQVLESPAGFYIGFIDETLCPYSRESNYFATRELAQLVLNELRG